MANTNSKSRARYHKNRAAGLCAKCGKVQVTKSRKVLCSACLEAQSYYTFMSQLRKGVKLGFVEWTADMLEAA